MEAFQEAKEIFVRKISKCSANNTYNVETNLGQHILTIQEDTKKYWHIFCCSRRPYYMFINDRKDNLQFTIFRPFKFSNWCFPCCKKQEIWVSDSRANDFALITQEYGFPNPRFNIINDRNVLRLTMDAPCCPYLFCCKKDRVFRVSSLCSWNNCLYS